MMTSDFPFKLNHVKQLSAWTILEAEDHMPALSYPALVGSGKLTVGVDATGLQSLPDHLMPEFDSKARLSNTRQCDLYVLHEGMISEHLLRDEANVYDVKIPKGEHPYGSQKNFMPLGYLAQVFTTDKKTYTGDHILPVSTQWKREWDLRHGFVRTCFQIESNIKVETEIFMPNGEETVYLKLSRGAVIGEKRHFTWNVRLLLETRTGLAIYDQRDSVVSKAHTVLASIDSDSIYQPNEPYRILYGIAADGMNVQTSQSGWEAVMTGPLTRAQTAYVRMDFRRYAGDECPKAPPNRRCSKPS